MTESKMYSQRVKNIPVMRYCGFNCVYCAFQKFQKISKCLDCRENNIHSHLEVLQRTPPKTKEGEFITVGLSGDVSFMHISDFIQVVGYCRKWSDRTFLIQSKDPSYFVAFEENGFTFPDNVILGTTIETNRIYLSYPDCTINRYFEISKAPLTYRRWLAMLELTCRKAVTIEPILDFGLDVMVKWIKDIAPEFVYIGFCNDGKQGKRLKLPEPSLDKTLGLINALEIAGIDVRRKTLRPAWYEIESFEPCLQCGTLRPRQETDADSMFCTQKCKREYEEYEKTSLFCPGCEEE